MSMSWQKTIVVLSITGWCIAVLSAFPADAREKHPVDFGGYLSGIQLRIDNAWASPRTGQSRTTVVRFKVHPNGSESDLRIARTSGDEAVDAAALRAVNDAA